MGYHACRGQYIQRMINSSSYCHYTNAITVTAHVGSNSYAWGKERDGQCPGVRSRVKPALSVGSDAPVHTCATPRLPGGLEMCQPGSPCISDVCRFFQLHCTVLACPGQEARSLSLISGRQARVESCSRMLLPFKGEEYESYLVVPVGYCHAAAPLHDFASAPFHG